MNTELLANNTYNNPPIQVDKEPYKHTKAKPEYSTPSICGVVHNSGVITDLNVFIWWISLLFLKTHSSLYCNLLGPYPEDEESFVM